MRGVGGLGLSIFMTLAGAGSARADGPAGSNGWSWMASSISESPACSGYAGALYCFWRGVDKTLLHSVYRNGSFPAPTRLDGILESAPSVGGSSSSAPDFTPYHQVVSVRGTDNAVWLREIAAGVPGHWYSIGAVIKGRPACSSVGYDSLMCVVRGLDDAIWVNGRGANRKYFGWARVNDANDKPRFNVRSSPQLISMLGGGLSWALLYLGDDVGGGKRELWIARQYGLGSTRANWVKAGVVTAALDSDINCPADQLQGIWGCVVRTPNNDVNHLTIPYEGPIGERILAKPNGFPVLGTPTLAYYTTSRRFTMIGIYTTQNHMWMRAD